MNEYVNEYINLYSTYYTESSEVLADNKMGFEFFANLSTDSDEVCSSTGMLFHVVRPNTTKL